MIKESFWMSWQNIVNNKMRSFLTILGIIIGVTSIITLVTIMNSATNQVTQEFSSLGVGKITITTTGTELKPGLGENDIQKLLNIDNVADIAHMSSFKGAVAIEGKLKSDVVIDGRDEYYFLKDAKIKNGRAINCLDCQDSSNVCIINQKICDEFFFADNPINKNLIINGKTFKIIGLLEQSKNNDISLNIMNYDDASIIIPYTSAMKLTGHHYFTYLDLYIKDTENSKKVVNDIENVLNEAFNYNEDSYDIINMDSLVESMKSITSMMSSLMGGIASIALIVGGIGIMNMMLVSVTERTKEIGLRKALGAEPRRIQLQFLIEAIVLSLMGGFLGLIFGILLSWLICKAISIPFIISMNAVLLAVGFSAAVGIIFGWAPARKASLLNPIDALRSD